MGDLEALSIQPNGFTIEDPLFSPSSPSPLLSNPSPGSISEECWQRAEHTTLQIIQRIQPTVVSEQNRKDVIEYVQRLIGGYLGSEVFPFGSVPLKTYLPDGDIDLTALSIQAVEDTLANDVRAVLEREEQNEDADYEVKDVQYIHAEVKLIKCLVQNIVVDISFNQLGGLCTLCFLEKADRVIGKNHLFKRSIILIKAWCYYESRILGAHHGLISTYALETLVLYIFHLFHSSLNGPLAVLYRFLDYYSKFDWDNFCISLNGPVSISSLPEIVAETPDNDGGDLLLDKEFLRDCVNRFSVPSRGLDTNSRSFPQKHFNIIDPLRENNNLGRSVSRGNFYRIRSAFTYGARKLGQILLLTAEDIADELNKFFMNTLDRHGSGQRPDVQVSVPNSSINESDPASSESAVEECTGNKILLESPPVSSSGTVEEVQDGISNIRLSGSHRKSSTGTGKEPQRCTVGLGSSLELLERFGYIKENGISGCRLIGDAEDHATTSRSSGPMVTTSTSECIPRSCELVTPALGSAHQAPHPSFRENGKIRTRNPGQPKALDSAILENNTSSKLSQATDRDMDTVSRKDLEASKLETNRKIDSCEEGSVTVGNEDGLPVSTLLDAVDSTATTAGSLGALSSLSDLHGDYDDHINSLQCARWCYDYTISPFLPIPPFLAQFRNIQALDTLYWPLQLQPNLFSHMNGNGVFPRPYFFAVHPHINSAEDLRHRGTGTYFPILGKGSYKEMTSSGRKSAPPVPHGGQFRFPLRESNWTETHFVEKHSHAPSQEQFSSLRNNAQPLQPRRFFQDNNYLMSNGCSQSHPKNGFSPPPEKLEFGSFGQLPPSFVVPSPEAASSRQPVAASTHTQEYSSSRLPTAAATTTTPRPRPALGANVEGRKKKEFHLKNEADFPPLAVRVAQRSK